MKYVVGAWLLVFRFLAGVTFYLLHMRKSEGKLVAVESWFNFGVIEPGVIVKHKFILKNIGWEAVKIINIAPSCGCTTAGVTKYLLNPGDTCQLVVRMNSEGKADGQVFKSVTVTSNSRVYPALNLTFGGEISMPQNKHIGTKVSPRGIFSDSCAKCHSEVGSGLLGMRLFKADCGMCHAEGGDALPVCDLWRKAQTRESLVSLISDGKAETNMPGFAHRSGGPLRDEQITSLADYVVRSAK